jgi:hypothetical protein
MDDDVPPSPDALDADPPSLDPGGPDGDDPVARDAAELRRLIDAGASTPEELRALAERIREHKRLEESLWRREVKPELLESKKLRYRRAERRADDRADDETAPRNLGIGLGLLGLVLVLLLVATQSTFLWILVPVVAILLYAYRQGRGAADGADREDPPA